MKKRCSIASVTLAYNSEGLLSRQLDVLLRQTRPLDEIIVVNNASTDGTLRLLSEHYPRVSVLNMPTNIGAGGFAAGLAYAATERKHDWVWLFDDDSVPRKDSLWELLVGLDAAKGSQSNVGVLACLGKNHETGLLYPGLLWRNGLVSSSLSSSKQSICFVDAVICSGMLVSREAVESVGLPRADFFMDFVDCEFCLRVRRDGFKIAVVPSSRLEHALGTPRTLRFLWFERVWADHAPWREYYMSRNQTFTIWNYYPDWRSKVFVFRSLLRHALGILLFGMRKGACFKMMVLGFFDGRAGKLGIRFRGDVVDGNSRAAGNEIDVGVIREHT